MADEQEAGRLRDAFAQLLAQGAHVNNPISMEPIWAMQGQQQLPPQPSLVKQWGVPDETGHAIPGQTMPMPQVPEPTFDFPQGRAGPGSPDKAMATLNAGPPPAPFGGKGKVVGPYDMPKSPKKNNKKKKKKGKD